MVKSDKIPGGVAAGNESFTGSLAVLESIDSAQKRSREVAKSLGYRLALESSAEAIERRLLGEDPPQLVLVALPESADLVKALRNAPRPPIVVASMAGPPETARNRFSTIDADLYSVRPHSVDSLGPILYAAGQLALNKKTMQSMLSTEERLRDRLHQAGHSGQITGFQHFDFFKKLLVLEIKRSKRFGYPIAVCVVGVDPLDDLEASQQTRNSLNKKVAAAIKTSIRDIDMPVDYATDRMLLFLPHTDNEGATGLAERVIQQVRKSAITREDRRNIRMSVSIGVAATCPGQEISFAKLMRDANAALKAAQLKGGNRAITR